MNPEKNTEDVVSQILRSGHRFIPRTVDPKEIQTEQKHIDERSRFHRGVTDMTREDHVETMKVLGLLMLMGPGWMTPLAFLNGEIEIGVLIYGIGSLGLTLLYLFICAHAAWKNGSRRYKPPASQISNQKS